MSVNLESDQLIGAAQTLMELVKAFVNAETNERRKLESELKKELENRKQLEAVIKDLTEKLNPPKVEDE